MKLYNGDGNSIHVSKEVIKTELLGPCSIVRSELDFIFMTYNGKTGQIRIYPLEGKPSCYPFDDMDIAIIEFLNMCMVRFEKANGI